MTFGALAMTLVLVATSFAVSTPTPAYAAPRYAEIVNRISGLRADVMWASTNPGQGVFLWPDNASYSQEFEFLDSGNGYFRIKARHSGQCLQLLGGNPREGAPIVQDTYCEPGYAPAEWRTDYIIPPHEPCVCFPETYTIIRNHANGRCLDAVSSSGIPGQQAPLQAWNCIRTGDEWNRWNQVWSIQYSWGNPPIH
ncbi:RICIN domain-containing protein [Streptosporangium sp. NPDC051023]|uniref:RICIN domain-containing protein n=1 Tax=Streptosporangium sp. NPDC051023 TaxID=3155410 RepID=UPI00344F154B